MRLDSRYAKDVLTKFFEQIVKHTLDNKYIEVQVTKRKQYIKTHDTSLNT